MKRSKPELPKGAPVAHREYGEGSVVSQWGSWFACNDCFEEVPLNAKSCRCGCRRKFRANGAGIYEVKFSDGLTRSINKCWLVVQ